MGALHYNSLRVVINTVGWQAVRRASNYTESIAREEAHAASTMRQWKRIVSHSKELCNSYLTFPLHPRSLYSLQYH